MFISDLRECDECRRDPNGFALIGEIMAEAESRATFESGEQLAFEIASKRIVDVI